MACDMLPHAGGIEGTASLRLAGILRGVRGVPGRTSRQASPMSTPPQALGGGRIPRGASEASPGNTVDHTAKTDAVVFALFSAGAAGVWPSLRGPARRGIVAMAGRGSQAGAAASKSAAQARRMLAVVDVAVEVVAPGDRRTSCRAFGASSCERDTHPSGRRPGHGAPFMGGPAPRDARPGRSPASEARQAAAREHESCALSVHAAPSRLP